MLSVNQLRRYDEFKNKIFYSSTGSICKINEALQTIQFDLDEEG
jgi:hypothetical protein